MNETSLKIYGINGPIITIKGKTDLFLYEKVFVGNSHLIGEVTSVNTEKTVIQVYENTSGLRPDEPVFRTGSLLCVTLGPGLLTGIYDGICRPLDKIAVKCGEFIEKGINISAIGTEKKWNVKLNAHIGDEVCEGQIYGMCMETSVIEHRLLIPQDVFGKVVSAVSDGEYTVNDELLVIETNKDQKVSVKMLTEWPIRHPRKTKMRFEPTVPLITGQRIIDILFPIAKGGTAAIPGGFGTGKTVTQHQLAKWSDADIIVYIGCGERGNEMTQVLTEFSELIDPKTKRSILDRTILIANTSNMPVSAREASIYTGITLAEYYRDMGYHVAVMADSTSRWAEALREISGRLEEMPAEEGFPAYLSSRLSAFYERAGIFETLCDKQGSVTIIGAVSPQGNDFSEPVTQNTKRFVRCYWALDKSLAYARHYPTINWTSSYSEYITSLEPWYIAKFGADFRRYRLSLQNLLNEESELLDIVKLIGADLLADEQKLILDTARVIRVGLLQQNALDEIDSYTDSEKQYNMMKCIIDFYNLGKGIIARQIPASQIRESGVYDILSRMKLEVRPGGKTFEELWKDITDRLKAIEKRYE